MALFGVGSYGGGYERFDLTKINAADSTTKINQAGQSDQANQSDQTNQSIGQANAQSNQSAPSVQSEHETETGQLTKQGTGTDADNAATRNDNPSTFEFDFKKHNGFQLVGATSYIEDMDVKKAISDMKKDAVLDQYKFFVNSNNLGTDQDGTVRVIKH
jgi:hypothetical protein